ncbi:MFS-type transporter SLC18B1 [Anabrus simplex]|uniref:MFS-type transporter SLC18B1 n=1 Tax=Anabrus simplex TaxID=316456 RepID=UPI0035A29108
MGINKHKFTRRELVTLLVLGSVHFASSICISLQAPFYPKEAELKGASATEYGLVFGSFELASFISSPIFGKYMNCIGAKFLLNTGIFVAAICSILFGLLDLVTSHVEFISLSFLLRIIEAVGSSAAITAAFSITATVFPDSVATTFATLEVFYGLGYIVGPTIGGLLFTAGGFILPFMVMGSVLMLDSVFIYFALPTLNDGSNRLRARGQLMQILRVPAVLLDSFSIMATAISMGFYSATLEPHLRDFNLSPVLIGIIFVISGGTYAVTAPLVGRLCDTRVYPKKLIMVGSMFIITSYLMVGPIPFFDLDRKLSLCIIGLIIHGLGLGCILVPCFIDAIRSSVAAGFGDDITTYGMISGLWASSFALGDFIGPSVAGVLYDVVGFRIGTLFVIGVHIIVFISVLTFVCVEKRPVPAPQPQSSLPPLEIDGDTKGCVLLNASWTQDPVPSYEIRSSPKREINGYGSVGSTLPVVKVSA